MTADGEGDEDDEDEDGAARREREAFDEQERERLRNVRPTVSRWISSIRGAPAPAPAVEGDAAAAAVVAQDPTFTLSYSLPPSRPLALHALALSPAATAAAAGHKRPAPVSRVFSAEEREGNRRRNADGFSKVLLGAA